MNFPRPIEDLEPRKRLILRAVVVEYVATAEPISSELLMQRYPLGVKSATIRNELADLLEMGLLEQPHTSAGRVPSDQGYRYYVDHLVKDDLVPDKDAAKLKTEGEVLQELLSETARMLSRKTQLLSAGLTFQDANVTIRNVIVSALSATQAMMVLIFSNGHVENKMLDCPAGLTLEDIGRTNEMLQQQLIGKPIPSLSKLKLPEIEPVSVGKLVQLIATTIKQIAKERTRAKVVLEGKEFILAQPEFRKSPDTDMLLETVHDPNLLWDALTAGSDGVNQITIGGEHKDERLRKLSIVRRSFKVGDRETGIVAIIGPTRMQYPATISLVDFTAHALSHALTRHFA